MIDQTATYAALILTSGRPGTQSARYRQFAYVGQSDVDRACQDWSHAERVRRGIIIYRPAD